MRPRFPRKPSISAHHNEWLSLIDVSGPFLATGVLLRAFPQGLDEVAPELKSRLRLAHEEWLDEASKDEPDPSIHIAWIRYVFRELLGVEARDVAEGQTLPAWTRVELPQHKETLSPSFALKDGANKLHLLVQIEPPHQDLERSTVDRPWRASPAARMMTLLHGAQAGGGPRLGLVTNGRTWMLVRAKPGDATSYVTWTSELFFDEPLTLRAFVSLLGLKRFFNVPDADTLDALFAESAGHQHEVTDQLGAQVRRAVEVLIQTIDRLDRARRGALLRGLDPVVLYEAAITVMMRLVFLLAAEERGLLLRGNDLYDQGYAASTLRDQLQEAADRYGEELLERRHDAWARLCATFRAIYSGIEHEDLRLPGYGGSLFDPDRFPFLEGRAPGTVFRDPVQRVAAPLAIDNRTVLHLLRAIQELESSSGRGERRRLSFRSLGVEQIGHVYEGLLDHTARRAAGLTVSLDGKREPEVGIAELEALKKKGDAALIDWLAERTGRSRPALTEALTYEPEPEDRRRLLQACENRSDLYERVRPWGGLVRKDTHDLPVVLDEGAIYVTDGDERRSTGTHYTPVTLTEPIVQYTLEPLVYEGPAEGKPRAEWRLKAPQDILSLRVCDLAMGSGAFLVQACRYLAERVVEAWAEAEVRSGYELVVAPDGGISVGAVGETIIPPLRPPPGASAVLPGMLVAEGPLFSAESPDSEPPPSVRGRPSRPPSKQQAREEERLTLARRYVADRCLFGVDKNPWAVEMAKLSLWLVTLQKARPFTFLDHALVAGDSLLGITDKEQLLAFHLDPKRGRELHDLFLPKKHVEAELTRAAKLREEIERLASSSIVDTTHKAMLEAHAREATSDLRILGDLLVGASLASQGKTATFERLVETLAHDAIRLLPADDEAKLPAAEQEQKKAARDQLRPKLQARAQELLDQHRGPQHPARTPFHWALAFPEVMARGGFDAFVGNPPFQGGLKLETALGTDYRAYLVGQLARGRAGVRGTADLCAYFFLRAAALIRAPGMSGLVATNTVAQGDTREVGLDALVGGGFTIPRATPSMAWPGDASLEVATVWLWKGLWAGGCVLAGKAAARITSQLTIPGRVDGMPYRLEANEGKAFQGSNILGLGFAMSPDAAQSLMAKDSKNRDVLFPYLNGQDLNSASDQRATRWIINFFDWPLERLKDSAERVAPVAADYPDCLAVVRELVKPERDALIGRNPMATKRGQTWWRYAGEAKNLYACLRGAERALTVAQVAKHHSFCFVPARQVFDQKTAVFSFRAFASFAALQSSAHSCWHHHYGASLETRPVYTPASCFETFPFPLDLSSLESIGERYHIQRAAIMKANNQGLTATYNRFHDPDEHDPGIQTLRDLHVEMDLAVLAAYDWSDLPLDHGYHQTKQGLRFTVSEAARVELLDRLLELNHQRYAEEVAAGLHEKDKPAKAKTRKAKPVKTKAPTAAPDAAPQAASNGRSKPARPQLGLGFDQLPAGANDDAPMYVAASAAKPAQHPQSETIASLSEDARTLLGAIEDASSPQGKSALVRASGIDAKRWPASIAELEQAGVVEQQGEGRGARYARKF